MDAVSLRDLYDHHAWSMDRLFARAAEVPQEQAARPPRSEGLPYLSGGRPQTH